MSNKLWDDVANLIEAKRDGRDAKDRRYGSWEIADEIRQMVIDAVDYDRA